MNIAVAGEKSGLRLICRMQENDRMDIVTLHMLKAQQIEGIMDAEGDYLTGGWWYDCNGLISIRSYLKGNVHKERVLKALKNIGEILKELEWYMIPWQRVLLKPDWIFVEPEDGWIYLVCLPVEELNEEWNLTGLCKWVASEVVPQSDMTHHYLDYLKEYSCKENGNDVESFLKQIALCENAEESVIKNDPVEVNTETVVWNNVRGILIRKRNEQKYMLDKTEVLIGKDYRSVDFCIMENPTISRLHAKISNRENQYYISDCRSTNHTYVNGKMLQLNEEIKLNSGDIIRMSNEEFQFQIV